MYDNRTALEAVSGFTAFSDYYWSSTEYDQLRVGTAFRHWLSVIHYSKNLYTLVRAVRAF